MKKITNKTFLKQGDKIYQPVEVDEVTYWIDTNGIKELADWVYNLDTPVSHHMFYKVTESFLPHGDKVIAQSQPKLEGVLVISLDNYKNILSEQVCKKQDLAGGFSGGIHERSVAGMFFRKGYKANPNHYTQKDIEKVIELARMTSIEENMLGSMQVNKYSKEEILEQINSISLIEIDKQFNIISYE